MRHLLALAVLPLPLAFASPVAAAEPTRETVTLHRSLPNFITCPGFIVSGNFDITRIVFTFYDSNGTPIRTVTHVHGEGTLTNTATGKTLADAGNQVITVDLLTGEIVVDGRSRVDTAPGAGVVLAQVGRIVREGGVVVSIDGRNDLVEGNLTDFCAYMAAP